MRCFEWGCGGSSVRFGPKASYWTSHEHNPKWAEKVRAEGGDVKLCNNSIQYVNADQHDLDFILVDGIHRNDCMIYTYSNLASPHTLVICHDANRTSYHTGVRIFPWHRKVADDLYIMALQPPSCKVQDLLNSFELRDYDAPSYAWDYTHPFGHHLDRCGYQCEL